MTASTTLAEKDEDSLSPAELLARCSAADLLAASTESSEEYNGRVLARALAIVRYRTRCRSLCGLAKNMGYPKSTLYRWAQAQPITRHRFDRALRDLAFHLLESGQEPSGQ